jgi:hypothetical protein
MEDILSRNFNILERVTNGLAKTHSEANPGRKLPPHTNQIPQIISSVKRKSFKFCSVIVSLCAKRKGKTSKK